MTILATLALALIALSAIIQAIYAFRKDGRRDPLSHFLLLGSAVILSALIALRSIAISFPALTGTFESLVFYSAVLCFVCFAYSLQRKVPFLPFVEFGATIAALVLLAVASSPLAPKEMLAPIPALRSGWLIAHVALSFIGESFFIAAFVASLAYLVSRDQDKRREYDRVTYTAVAIGYPIFTAGALIFGMIWADRAWGSWWSWDPKETWALVTWLVYTFYLHIRLTRKREGTMSAWISVLGFLCTTFTFFGVNYLLSGLHSYR
jgi:ABC-type transport system involved in cytochrome c biogenesis permease subunit